MSTIDPQITSGTEIPIEERDPEEITMFGGEPHTVPDARAFNPAFDVTPATLIAGIITEYGVLRAPYTESITRALQAQNSQNAARKPSTGA